MDTTTASFYNHSYPEYDVDFIDNSEFVNKRAQIGCWITIIILACLLNGSVIFCVIDLFVKQPAVRLGLRKLPVMLACSVLQVCNAGISAVGVHINRVKRTEVESTFSCGTTVALELGSFMLLSMVSLLVAVLAFVECFRLQRFVIVRPGIRMVGTVALVVLSVLYGFVVIIPVFFLLWVNDENKPCHEGSVYIDINPDLIGVRAMAIAYFIVPQCLVCVSCFLLLLAYFTRRCASQPQAHALHSHTPLSDNVSGLGNGNRGAAYVVDATASQGSDTPFPAIHIPAGDLQPILGDQGHGLFPWYVIVAAAFSFVLGFVFFFQSYADLRLPREKSRKLWVAGVLLAELKGVFLPCCWLLDREVRTVWSCCRGSRCPGGSARSPGEGGEELANLGHM